MQEKYMEYQMLEEQLKQAQEQVQTLNKQKEELEGLKEAVMEIGKTKEGNEMFVPISSGIFIKAQIKDNKELLVNVGDNVVVPKSINDAVALIKRQKEEIDKYETAMAQNVQLIMLHQQKVEAELYGMTQDAE
jgi:prefoldin alpha subunit